MFDKERPNDVTQLLATFQTTRVTGLVSLLYGLLLLQGGSVNRVDTPPPPLSQPSLTLILATFSLFNHLATLDLHLLQVLLQLMYELLCYNHVYYVNHGCIVV